MNCQILSPHTQRNKTPKGQGKHSKTLTRDVRRGTRWRQRLPQGEDPKQTGASRSCSGRKPADPQASTSSPPRQRKQLGWSLLVSFLSPARLPEVWAGMGGPSPTGPVSLVSDQQAVQFTSKVAQGFLLQLLQGHGRKNFLSGLTKLS